jgi:serine protease SohB
MELVTAFIFFLIKLFVVLGCFYLVYSLLSSKTQGTIDLSVTTFHDRYLSDQLFILRKISPKNLLKKSVKIIKSQSNTKHAHNLFVVDFIGDIKASQTESLKEIVTLLCTIVNAQDEVLITIDSPGGQVHQYGYAASQLVRLRERCHLTVAIDRIGASGGYLMACVAHKIIAAPFAIVGSIGVIGQVPNVHRFLKQHLIDVEEHTAGEYKRSLSIVGENSPEKISKFKQELEDTHILFQKFVKDYRPQVAQEVLLTGEHFYATMNLEKHGLVDKIMTSDEYILSSSTHKNILYLKVTPKATLIGKLTQLTQTMIYKVIESIQSLKCLVRL